MVWQTFNRNKSASREDNSSTSSSASSSPPTPTPTSNASTTSTAQTSNSNPSSKRPPPPRPPPPPPRPSPRSSAHSSGDSTSGYGSLPTDLPFSMTPAGRFFTQFFDEAMRYFDYPMHDIAWSDELPGTYGCNGNSVREIIVDNDEKFSIEIDVSDFLPEELSVNYDEEARELLVEGYQKGRTERLNSVERHFKRKFDIPVDARDGALAAYLTPTGQLTVQTSKKGIRQANRRIPIQAVSDVPDPVDRSTPKASAPESTKSTTSTPKTGPTTQPKLKKSPNVSERKPPKFPKKSRVADKISQFEKADEEENKQSESEQKRPTKEPEVKREYLNIFANV